MNRLVVRRRKLKLFVWEGVLRDYTGGALWALAYDAEHARTLISEKMGHTHADLAETPRLVEAAEGFYVYGGG